MKCHISFFSLERVLFLIYLTKWFLSNFKDMLYNIKKINIVAKPVNNI